MDALREVYIKTCETLIAPIQPRRRLGDKDIDGWLERDDEIKQCQWENLVEQLTDDDDTDDSFNVCWQWDCMNGVDEMDEEVGLAGCMD
ncbi:hypothetical protein CAEBREN_02016 [Caenorhabditis brenneri]|uniref:Uncharacterized protein n=1 Tax=Caenorhabditis brenneri TaxID=135651 RepID=G0N594_CAEBE|nr:hypothetical protein CAEBREN_02016 [Caenorhabditis brenneri]